MRQAEAERLARLQDRREAELFAGRGVYEVVTSAGHLLAKCPNLEDARDVRDLMDRKLRAQGFTPPRYPARLVGIRYAPTV